MSEALNPGTLIVFTRIAVFAIGLAVAIWTGSRLSHHLALDSSRIRRMTGGAVLAGLLAARLAHVALNWHAFAAAPRTALYLWQSGYVPAAGVAGGALYLLLRLRREHRRLPYLRVVTGGLAAGALILAVGLLAMSHLPQNNGLRVGDKVPDFTLLDLEGDTVALSDLTGKGVVLNFWATWCPPCRDEMPLLEAAWNEYRARNVAIVGIALGQAADVVRPFVDSRGISYPIWTDPGPGHDGALDSNAIFDWFDSAGVPTTVFIRADGTIAGIHVGELHRSLLLQRLKELVPK